MAKAVAVKLSSRFQETVRESVDEESPVAVSPTGEKCSRIWHKIDCISHSPRVSTSILDAGPVPALLTAATDTVYRVDEVSPEIVATLLLE